MSGWSSKRFWTKADAVACEGGFEVQLDGRGVKTPAKAPLVVPTKKMAQAIADEWNAQEEAVDPLSMPTTRSANAAIDKVRVQFDEVANMVADYGDSDLLCYRADSPQELIERQNAAWNPVLDWAESELGVRLELRTGIMHTPQDPRKLEVLRQKVHALSPFELTALHDLVGMSGSLILGFATALKFDTPDSIWKRSRVDEQWQIDQWGDDEEDAETVRKKEVQFLHAHRFYALCHTVE